MSVMHWGKHNVSNALNSTDIVVYKLTALALIDLLGYFKSAFGL